MGMTTIRVENRACATCQNWRGVRGIERLGSARVIRCDTSRQPCVNKPGTLSTPGAHCGDWVRWGRI